MCYKNDEKYVTICGQKEGPVNGGWNRVTKDAKEAVNTVTMKMVRNLDSWKDLVEVFQKP